MASTCCSSACATRSDKIVCACLRVTAAELTEALATREIRTLKDLRCQTGAGDGCMACHRLLRRYLEQHAYSSSSLEPICSDR